LPERKLQGIANGGRQTKGIALSPTTGCSDVFAPAPHIRLGRQFIATKMKTLTSALGFVFRPILILKDYPVLFRFGKIYIVTVGLIAAAAAVSALVCMTYYYRTMFPLESAGSYFMWKAASVILMTLIFSKIFHYFALGSEFLRNPKKYLADTAYYDQGGQFGGLVGTILFSYYTQINFFACMDINLTAGCLAFAIGRVGCYCYGCCHGCPIESRFATVYTNPDSKALRIFPELVNVPLAPTQLVSATFSFALFGSMVWLLSLAPTAGLVSAYAIVVYNIFRLFIEQYRVSVINPSQKVARISFFRKVAAFITSFGIFYIALVLWYSPNNLKTVEPTTFVQFIEDNIFTLQSVVLLSLIVILYIVAWGIHYKKLGQHFEWTSA
jgi:prolipoprotein diacylglyceryltransferase